MIEQLAAAALGGTLKKAVAKMTAKTAIEVLNRRAVTMQKLFGKHSEIFEQWSTQMAKFDIFTDSNGFLKLRNTKANRAMYRQLIPWAKREQKLNVKVLERKAAKLKQEWQDDIDDGFIDEDTFVNEQVYNAFLNDCADYFDSCYQIAANEGYEGKELYEVADALYNDRSMYINMWNAQYLRGDYSEYENYYQQEQFNQQYDIDDETGEPIEKSDFYRGL